ncbi:pimeloyl-ACP methyl ester carboxylesterase [Pararhizobium capsulatum DSM 1112]|uniref:Pimeloyl-ACP methyl ester carboxylesterase n=1 Tax=Pararhizobium capsulatum DSM 1112 TaxID=1121113 RepID=A0ABU0BU87_9HYPH|nr:alpha/beta hydrolase [Pararhizobium capsulatum]MDQ0321813.1 pimeloyl-ACP methyl ester carboxylesterase [Pararhizobium capsulatum DSM 1112]
MLLLSSLALLVLATGYGYSAYQTGIFEGNRKNEGELIDVGGFLMNNVHVPRPAGADLPPIVFIHGASASLLDPLHAFLKPLSGRAEMLFLDRPGLGYSQRGGPRNAWPDGQADAIAALMEKRGIKKAIIVSHSFGGAIAASFALNHPDRVAGLLFLAPATHPWPGGIDWYYRVARAPVIGWIFSRVLAAPIGSLLLDKGVEAVFAPNPVPANYVTETNTYLALRPTTFRNNATDVANLLDYVERVSPRYREIKAPTIIITGDRDGIVYPHIHSRQLHEAIAGSRLISIHNLGHKPDYVANDLAVAAIETLGGKDRDLDAIAARVAARIARDGVDSEPADGQ